MSRPTISVIIPTLNEQENLQHVLPRIPNVVDEVILVDGHSTDATIETARELMPDIRVVMQDGFGKGAALRTGFAAATGDIIVMLDADGSTDPEEIPSFVHALLAGADFAKGSRFLHSAGTADMPFHRRWGNQAFVRMVRNLYGGRYTDLCYGYNAFWRRVLPVLDLDGDGFEIETMMNIRALRAGLRVVEVPSYEDRRVIGIGRLRTVPDGWRVLRTIWRERSRPILAFEPTPRGEWYLAPGLRSSAILAAVPITPDEVGSLPANGSGQAASNGNGHAVVNGNGNGFALLNGNGQSAANGNGSGNGHHAYPTERPFDLSIAEAGAGDYVLPAPQAVAGVTWEGLADEYLGRLSHLIAAVDREAIARVVDELRAARERGATVFIAGNGGSSATASHWVNDLGKATKASGQLPLRSLSLSDNVPWLTALANDEGVERVFAGQLENFATAKDVLIVISASGNSPNILRVLETARGFGMRTIGLVGFDGGRAMTLLDQALWVETELGAYGLVETAHSALADIITTCLINDRASVSVPSN